MRDNKAIRMIAIDIDGTLLNSKHEITEYTVTIINKAIEQGIIVVISTGRVASGIPQVVLQKLNLSYIISANGANLYDVNNKQTIESSGMNSKYAASLVSIIEEYDCLFDAFIGGAAFAEEDRLIISNRYVNSPLFNQYIQETRYGVYDLKNFIIANNGQVEKVNLFFRDMDIKNKVLERLTPFSDCYITSGMDLNIEVTDNATTKGTAIKKLASNLHIDVSEVMAIGDSDNDKDMLEAAGIAVVMDNAKEEIKAYADYVTKSNDEDGVAKAIEKYVWRKENQ